MKNSLQNPVPSGRKMADTRRVGNRIGETMHTNSARRIRLATISPYPKAIIASGVKIRIPTSDATICGIVSIHRTYIQNIGGV
jgi:hypothetical protein